MEPVDCQLPRQPWFHYCFKLIVALGFVKIVREIIRNTIGESPLDKLCNQIRFFL